MGFNCSGLALYAIYKAGGPDLFGGAHSTALANCGTAVSLEQSQWRVGDILWFAGFQHLAIWKGRGMVVHADTAVDPGTTYGWGDGVTEVQLKCLTRSGAVTSVRRFSTG